MNRTDFEDKSRFKHMGEVCISSVFVRGKGSPIVDVYWDSSSSTAFQVFKPSYGDLFRRSADKPNDQTGLHPYMEWTQLAI